MSDLWLSALSRLSGRIAPHTYEMWIRPIVCLGIDGSRIRLRAPNLFVKQWFELNFRELVLAELAGSDGTAREVEIEVADESVMVEPRPLDDARGSVPPSAGAGIPGDPELAACVRPRDASTTETGDETGDALPIETGPTASGHITIPTGGSSGLNTRYTFESFVSGPSNQLAHAAARAVASPEPPKYNPLFMCGGVGLGKTHLLHAIGIEILRQRPATRVVYLSGERFMNDYIHSIRNNRMPDFRRRYRDECDVLLLDDIQYFANKDGTQDEFFHTFNALYERQKHIVLSADRKPHEIPDIADRLRSRFAWGLMADIEPPELEVRIAILKKKAAIERLSLPDDVALYIASAVKSNVRELEGAFIRVSAYASLSNVPVTLEFARAKLESSIARPSDQVSVEHVQKTVAGYYQVKIADLKSERRHKSIAAPRAVAMYLARNLTGASYPDLGRAFGDKHHTTIISAVAKTTERLKTDTALRAEIQAIEATLKR